jgi:hypothetical protein
MRPEIRNPKAEETEKPRSVQTDKISSQFAKSFISRSSRNSKESRMFGGKARQQNGESLFLSDISSLEFLVL